MNILLQGISSAVTSLIYDFQFYVCSCEHTYTSGLNLFYWMHAAFMIETAGTELIFVLRQRQKRDTFLCNFILEVQTLIPE